jgi:GTP-binding protein
MAVPQVVIVGRPNVGKSSLLNWLANVRLAIVDDQPGITRDRLTHLMCHQGRYFELVDTGGIGVQDSDQLTEHIEEQIELAIDSADIILFVVDTREGILPLDEEVARRLRYVTSPLSASPTRPTIAGSTRRRMNSIGLAGASCSA